MKGRIYVALASNNTMNVFETSQLNEPCETIQVNGMEKPIDVVARGDQEQLYIADNKNDDTHSYIWRVDLTSDSQVTKFAEFPFQLRSVALASGGLLITPMGIECGGSLLMHKWNGDISVVRLPSDVCLTYTMQMSGETFFACCQPERGSLTEFTSDGSTINCYVEADKDQLRFDPRCATQYYARGLLVADAVNDRVILVNAHLQLEGLLSINKCKDLGSIQKLCFDEILGLHFMGHANRGISVYRVCSEGGTGLSFKFIEA